METNKVAEYLKQAGIPVLAIQQPQDETDGDIKITSRVNVQVGTDFVAILVKVDTEKYHFLNTSMDRIVENLKELLAAKYPPLKAKRTGHIKVVC